MSKIRVSAVSYTNTKPFVYGLEHSGIFERIELSLDNPSDCAKKLIDNQVDIGLIPVAALPDIPRYSLISNFCIGADGAVNSVFIFSQKPIHEIKSLRLDPQSRTSNALAKILIKNFWQLAPNFVVDGEAEAYVEIGDRTFDRKNHVPFVYDLAAEWKSFTGLPFAFAVWASNKTMAPEFLNEFNRALEYGLKHRSAVIRALPKHPDIDLEDYLLNKIDYSFTEAKKKALNLFLHYLKTLD